MKPLTTLCGRSLLSLRRKEVFGLAVVVRRSDIECYTIGAELAFLDHMVVSLRHSSYCLDNLAWTIHRLCRWLRKNSCSHKLSICRFVFRCIAVSELIMLGPCWKSVFLENLLCGILEKSSKNFSSFGN